jgi:uncharacterized protein (DUF302 family)
MLPRRDAVAGVARSALDRATRADYVQTVSAYERVPVDAPPDAVVAALRNALRSRGITEYAVVDHGRDMAAAGSPGVTAWTLVFGNPAAGARLLAEDLAAAVDIPLRLAVIAAGPERSEVVLRDMRSLLPAELAHLADGFTQVLRRLASDARDDAVAPPGGMPPAA